MAKAFTVKKGRRYRAKIQVPFLKRAFASEQVIEGKLTEVGFTAVSVKGMGGGTYWAFGRWPNDDITQEVDYVEELEEV